MFHLVDADAFTRGFYARRGNPLRAAQPVPVNPLERIKAERSRPSGLTRADPESPTRFAETLAGRAPSTKRLQAFLERSGQILRFFAIWNGPLASPGSARESRRYKLHFFLEDDTAECVEVLNASSGCEFGHFMRRGPLARPDAAHDAAAPRLGAPAGDLPAEFRYKAADFRIGGTVVVQGRPLLLHAADDFTCTWYCQQLGRTEAEMRPLDVQPPKKEAPIVVLPPHTGVGDEEDSLQSCIKLASPSFSFVLSSLVFACCRLEDDDTTEP
jgi:EF-hand domain-containing protein 1